MSPEERQSTDRASSAPRAETGAALVPGWLRRMTALGWRTLVVVALALALSTTTLAILVGAIVGATFLPVVRYMRVERSWSPGRAAGVASVLALGTVLVIVVLVVIAFAPYVGSMVQAVRDGVAQVLARLTELGAPP